MVARENRGREGYRRQERKERDEVGEAEVKCKTLLVVALG